MSDCLNPACKEKDLHPAGCGGQQYVGQESTSGVIVDEIELQEDTLLRVAQGLEEGGEELATVLEELQPVPPGKNGFGVAAEPLKKSRGPNQGASSFFPQ